MDTTVNTEPISRFSASDTASPITGNSVICVAIAST